MLRTLYVPDNVLISFEELIFIQHNQTRSTPLHLASLHGETEMVALLLEYLADVDARDEVYSSLKH